MSASAAATAAAACRARSGWWKVRTVSSSPSARGPSPPPSACSTMFASPHSNLSVARRSASLSMSA
eukprot:3352388-Pleurochrysis_carterae.AAC.1